MGADRRMGKQIPKSYTFIPSKGVLPHHSTTLIRHDNPFIPNTEEHTLSVVQYGIPQDWTHTATGTPYSPRHTRMMCPTNEEYATAE